eukprot:TRINITY_DN68050_c11_g5_i1.p1 TRINITY_DN68050_c11_g5~~TRINITY_DN68050_c11_g5_i1.p1  ORF type:complete len:175 (-),score=7.17 TRINITY_DN68050_c11_g5_i1:470-994(-)
MQMEITRTTNEVFPPPLFGVGDPDSRRSQLLPESPPQLKTPSIPGHLIAHTGWWVWFAALQKVRQVAKGVFVVDWEKAGCDRVFPAGVWWLWGAMKPLVWATSLWLLLFAFRRCLTPAITLPTSTSRKQQQTQKRLPGAFSSALLAHHTPVKRTPTSSPSTCALFSPHPPSLCV